MIDSEKYLDVFRTLPVEEKYDLVTKLLQKIHQRNEAYEYILKQIEATDDRTDHILIIICEELLRIYDRAHSKYQDGEDTALSRARRRIMYLRSLQEHNRKSTEEKHTLHQLVDSIPEQNTHAY